MSHLVSVQLDVLRGLLGELAALAAELDDDAGATAVTGRAVADALPGEAGTRAAAAGEGWSAALTALAARTCAVAATLEAAIESYRAADEQIAQRIEGPVGRTAVAR
ncbi:hypothetical protein [Modestobacter sp. NPDC049651]|uniref:hypothetical protein n=1 Tax=unclassified Modestobacter TaxID=2643866 RepID=UPI0033D4A5A8